MGLKTYQVFWAETAKRDLEIIITYIAAESDERAQAAYRAIKEKAESLHELPLKGRVVPELCFFHISTYRELICSPWRLIYKVEDKKVWVLAVVDGRRNVEDILLDRLV